MARLNPLTLKRPGDVEASETFTDPLQPGEELTVSLKVSASSAQDAVLTERIRDLAARYVLGDAEYRETKDKPEPKGKPPIPLLDNETAQQIPVSGDLCVDIAYLMQAEEMAAKGKPGADEPYSFEEWVYFADRMPTAFKGAVALVQRLVARSRGLAAGDDAGNAAGESGATGKPE